MFHFAFVSFRVTFVFGILQPWLNSFADPDKVSRLSDDLGITLLCSIFVSPINGIIFDAVTTKLRSTFNNEQLVNMKASVFSLSVNSFCCVMLSLMMVIFTPYGTFVFILLSRSFALGGAITFISVNFPAKHIGKLIGLCFLVAGLASLLQYPLLQLAFAIDPTFYYIHIGMLVLSLLTFGHPILIYLSTKKFITPPEYPFLTKGLKESLKVANLPIANADLGNLQMSKLV